MERRKNATPDFKLKWRNHVYSGKIFPDSSCVEFAEKDSGVPYSLYVWTTNGKVPGNAARLLGKRRAQGAGRGGRMDSCRESREHLRLDQ